MYKSVEIIPTKLRGKVCVPPSKSAAHRAILCAAMADGNSVISNVSFSQDILATIGAVRRFGADVSIDGTDVKIYGISKKNKLNDTEIDCNESGSTLRFIIPVALAIGGNFSVTGRGRLMERPLDDYYRIFDKKGISYKKESDRIYFDGRLSSGIYELSGNVSSQYITGLLFALPILSADSEIVITTPLESAGYIKMTIETLASFGIEIESSPDLRHFYIKGNQSYQPCDYTVEGDYSQAAFYFVANELGNSIEVEGLPEKSAQGDRAILDIIKLLKKGDSEHTIDASQIPDLVPILTVLATQTKGITHITGAKRLRIKESDRLAAITNELTKLGARIKEYEDSISIYGKTALHGGEVDSHNDHRISMSLAIASTVASGNVKISGADSVKKSYGDFWEVFSRLGGKISNEQ